VHKTKSESQRIKEVKAMKRIACGIGLVLSFGLLGLSASAQNQAANSQSSTSGTPSGSSLGDYARQVRKDPGGTQKKKVFDNDNLPTDDKLSVIGPTAATMPSSDASADAKPADSGAAPGAGSAPTDTKTQGDGKAPLQSTAKSDDKAPLKSSAKTPEEDAAAKEAEKQAAIKQWGDKITAQKDQIDLTARELDVLQREYQIRAAAMYADAGNRIRNSGDWDKQDAQYKQQIADKQKALDDAKQKLEDMQEGARKAGVPSSVSEP
jgi:hypothetical protein